MSNPKGMNTDQPETVDLEETLAEALSDPESAGGDDDSDELIED